MDNRQMVDAIYQHLNCAPNGLNPTVVEVLRAVGKFASAILEAAYEDQAKPAGR